MTMDWIEEAAQVGKELKELIREGHALLRDLKTIVREINQAKIDTKLDLGKMIPLVVKASFEESISVVMFDHQKKMEDLAVESVEKIAGQVLTTVKETMDVVDKDVTKMLQLYRDALDMK